MFAWPVFWQYQRCGEQHSAVISVVGQGTELEFFGRGPRDVASGHAGWQFPRELRGQSGVAGVQPIGVPLRCVLKLQTRPNRLSRCDTFWGMHQQFSCGLRAFECGLSGEVADLRVRGRACQPDEQAEKCGKKSCKVKAGHASGR